MAERISEGAKIAYYQGVTSLIQGLIQSNKNAIDNGIDVTNKIKYGPADRCFANIVTVSNELVAAVKKWSNTLVEELQDLSTEQVKLMEQENASKYKSCIAELEGISYPTFEFTARTGSVENNYTPALAEELKGAMDKVGDARLQFISDFAALTKKASETEASFGETMRANGKNVESICNDTVEFIKQAKANMENLDDFLNKSSAKVSAAAEGGKVSINPTIKPAVEA